MSNLTQGFADVHSHIEKAAFQLLDMLPPPSHIVIGLQLPEQTIDMLLVLPPALLLGLDAGSEGNPTEAARALAAVAQLRAPVHAFWFGKKAAPAAPGLPAFERAEDILRAAKRLNEREAHLSRRQIEQLVAALIDGQPKHVSSPLSLLRRSVRDALQLPRQLDQRLQQQVRQPFLLRRWSGELEPADLNNSLATALLDPANYQQVSDDDHIVPNLFVVTLNPDDYRKRFAPIAQIVRSGWQERLQEALNTANQRAGRSLYRWNGPLNIEIRAGDHVAAGSAEIDAAVADAPHPTARRGGTTKIRGAQHVEHFLRTASGHTYQLQAEQITIGRHPDCTITLPDNDLQISAFHTILRRVNNGYKVHDGSPWGRPSTNGTLLNGQPLGTDGQMLHNGDRIALVDTAKETFTYHTTRV